MRRKFSFKFILIGGILLLIGQLAVADVLIDTYKVDGFASDNLEVGATFRVTVKYRNDTNSNQQIVGAKFYFDYDTTYLDVINESAITDNLAGSLTSKTNPNFTPAPGQVRYQRDAAGGAGLTVKAGETVTCFTVTFHVKQSDGNAGTRTILQWLTPVADNVKLVAPGDVNITGNIKAFQNANLRASAVPTFTGINSVTNPATGNTLNLDWTTNGNAATDLHEEAATYYEGTHDVPPHDGRGLRFNIYRGTTSPPATRIVPEHNAFTYTDTGLDDGTRYYYIVRSQDNCTPRHNEDTNSTVQSAIPTDHTPPDAPTNFRAASTNQALNLSWNPVSGDVGGYMIIRYLSKPASDPPLKSAKDNDPNNEGIKHGDEYKVGTEIGGGKVIYNGTATSFTDNGADLPEGHLTNGTTYYYKVFAYDPVEGTPRQQGRNYSRGTDTSGTPGVAPSAISNFFAISSPEAGKISLFWNKPPEDFYGGVIFWYTTDFDQKWDWYKTWRDASSGAINPQLDAAPDEWLGLKKDGGVGGINVLAVYKTDPAIPAGGQEMLVLSNDLAGTALDLSKVYFIKALAYNATGVDFPTDLAGITADVLRGRRFSEIRMAASLPAGGSTGISTLTYNLKASASDKLVVNSITVPAGAGINKASELIRRINEKAGKNIVIVLGKWDPVTGTAVGLKPDGEGTDFDLKPGEGYQLYVNEDFTLTLP
jgi:hypothetical protein